MRYFLGWNKPFIDSTTEYLITTEYSMLCSAGLTCKESTPTESAYKDLSKILIVVPSERAGRELVKSLAIAADASNCLLLPPRIATTNQAIQCLLQQESGILTGVLQEQCFLTATHALRPEASFAQTLSISQRVSTLRTELFMHLLSLPEAFELLAEQQIPDTQVAIWEEFIAIEQGYLQELRAQKLVDPIEAAQRWLKGLPVAASPYDAVILAGCADVQPLLLALIKACNLKHQFLIFAPEEKQDCFDENGRILPQHWLQETCQIKDENLLVVAESFEQSWTVRTWLEKEKDVLQPQSVAIATCDPHTTSAITLELESVGITCKANAGRNFSDSSPGSFLKAIHTFVVMPSHTQFENVLLHPATLGYIEKACLIDPIRVIQEWQEFLETCLPNTIELKEEAHGSFQQLEAFPTLANILKSLSSVLLQEHTSTLSQHTESLINLLELFFSDFVADVDNADCIKITLELLCTLRETKCNMLLKFSEAIQFILAQLARVQLAESSSELAQVEIMGWLDFIFDRTPLGCLTAANEGFIPEVSTATSHLPDSVRTSLGLVDNRFRFARDMYWLNAACTSKRQLLVIASKRNTQGEELLLSRLLLQLPDKQLAQRLHHFFKSGFTPQSGRSKSTPYRIAQRPESERLLKEVPVTALELFKLCPYRFYLRHILRIADRSDPPKELSPLHFGTIAHDILRTLLTHEKKAGQFDGDEMIFLIEEEIELLSRTRFSHLSYPAISVQLENLRNRLASFVEAHYQHRAQGWQTLDLENRVRGTLNVQDLQTRMPLVGQIDRIDYHPTSREVRIYDYKTSEQAVSPEQYHRKGSEWVRFQLPAYHGLIANSEVLEGLEVNSISMALFNLPRDLSKTGELVASWSHAELQEAQLEIVSLVSKIAEQRFSLLNPLDMGYQWVCDPSDMDAAQFEHSIVDSVGNR
jgi:ATP-dependent helicase/nuclease subunit B